MGARDSGGEDRILAELDEARRVLTDARATRERLAHELEELRENLRRFRAARRESPPDRLDGGASDDARV